MVWEAMQENETFQSGWLDAEVLSPVETQAGDRKITISLNLERCLQDITNGEEIKQHWTCKRNLKEDYNLIYWEVYQ